MQRRLLSAQLLRRGDDALEIGQVELEKVNIGRRVLFLNLVDGSQRLVLAASAHVYFGTAGCQTDHSLLSTGVLCKSSRFIGSSYQDVDLHARVASSHEIHPPLEAGDGIGGKLGRRHCQTFQANYSRIQKRRRVYDELKLANDSILLAFPVISRLLLVIYVSIPLNQEQRSSQSPKTRRCRH